MTQRPFKSIDTRRNVYYNVQYQAAHPRYCKYTGKEILLFTITLE